MMHAGLRGTVSVLGACLALAGLPWPVSAATTTDRGIAAPSARSHPSKTTGNISCRRLPHLVMRCTMAIRGGAGISGVVTMRITRGTVVMATGRGRLTGGRATLTMRLRGPLSRGDYKVAMVITHATIRATMVLRVG